jgi:hypothetical protein
MRVALEFVLLNSCISGHTHHRCSLRDHKIRVRFCGVSKELVLVPFSIVDSQVRHLLISRW